MCVCCVGVLCCVCVGSKKERGLKGGARRVGAQTCTFKVGIELALGMVERTKEHTDTLAFKFHQDACTGRT